MRPPKSVAARPSAARIWRVLKLFAHLWRGLLTTWFLFPGATEARRSALTRAWSRKLLHLCGVRLIVEGELPKGHDGVARVIVANHISWVDIFAINSVEPVAFIAKAELAEWPLAGRLLKNTRTIFIDRARRRDTGRVTKMLAAHLAQGEMLAFFPEGKVSHGHSVTKFHASLLQPAVEARAEVIPIAIQYSPLTNFDYVNRNFLQSVWAVLGARRAEVRITILPIQTSDDRRALAKSLEVAIRSQIAPKAAGTAPEISPDH